MKNGDLEGLLSLDKPVGQTSHDIVSFVRSRLGVRRVGHSGTLDPFASGLLLLCLGRSTRLVEYLHGFPKRYEACARLGVSTSTDDPEGDVVFESDAWKALTVDEIASTLGEFLGVVDQRPPRYSAKKVRGTPAYARSRRGEEISLPSVPVTIHSIEITGIDLPHVRFDIQCGTGTYVRAIARDLGEALGVGAHLTELRRVEIGPFRVEAAFRPEDLPTPDQIAGVLIPPLEVVSHLPRLEVTQEEAARISSGQALELQAAPPSMDQADHAVVFQSQLLAVAVRDGSRFRPRKVFSRE